MERTEPLWSKDSTYGLKLYKWITWPIGTWPFGCENIFSIFRLSLAIISQLSLLISLIAEVFQNCISISDKIDYIGNLSCVAMCLIKMTIIRLHHNQMFPVLSSAIKDWLSDKDGNSLKIMKSYAKKGRSFLIGQMSFVFFTVGIMIISNLPLLLTDESKFENISLPLNPLPLPMDCFYKNLTKTTNVYVYVIQSLQLFYTTFGYCGTDVFFFGLAMHICGQLEILRNDMSQFGEIEDKTQLRRNLGSLIERHNHLINMCRQLEDSFSGILMIQLFFNSFIIVVLGIQVILTIKTGDIVLLSRFTLALIVIMVQFFIYCYAGDYLTTLNEILMDAIYNCHWYNFPRIIGKDLIFIMMRTRVKFHITAGKLCNMDMENFKNIIKASMSYISVMMIILNLDD